MVWLNVNGGSNEKARELFNQSQMREYILAAATIILNYCIY